MIRERRHNCSQVPRRCCTRVYRWLWSPKRGLNPWILCCDKKDPNPVSGQCWCLATNGPDKILYIWPGQDVVWWSPRQPGAQSALTAPSWHLLSTGLGCREQLYHVTVLQQHGLDTQNTEYRMVPSLNSPCTLHSLYRKLFVLLTLTLLLVWPDVIITNSATKCCFLFPVFGRQYQSLLILSLTDTSEAGKNITTCFSLVFKTTKRKPFFAGPGNLLLLFIGRLWTKDSLIILRMT